MHIEGLERVDEGGSLTPTPRSLITKLQVERIGAVKDVHCSLMHLARAQQNSQVGKGHFLKIGVPLVSAVFVSYAYLCNPHKPDLDLEMVRDEVGQGTEKNLW